MSEPTDPLSAMKGHKKSFYCLFSLYLCYIDHHGATLLFFLCVLIEIICAFYCQLSLRATYEQMRVVYWEYLTMQKGNKFHSDMIFESP